MRYLQTAFFGCLLFCLGISYGQSNQGKYYEGLIYFMVKPQSGVEVPKYSPQNPTTDKSPLPAEIYQHYQIKKLYNPFRSKTSEKLQNTYKVKFDRTGKVESLIDQLESLSYVEYAEKIPVMKLVEYTPNDPGYSNQWAPSKIDADSAWEISKGSATTTVAVTDNAIDTNHVDLDGDINNPGEVPGGGDDDGNGYGDDPRGYDVADNDADPVDNTYSHGTHTAGLCGAQTDNGTGIAAAGFNVNILPVKIARSSDGALIAGPEGIDYATVSGADVINMSWGGGHYSTLQNAVENAYNNGVTLVGAAGNDDVDTRNYPAAYSEVIAVASSDQNDEKSWFSNYGDWIDVTAPGSSIYSTTPNDNYGDKSGTSMASPITASVAGLMLSVNPGMSPDSVESCLESSAEPMPNSTYYNNGDLGAGRINAYGAISCAGASDSSAPTADFKGNPTTIYVGNTVDFTDLSSNSPTSWSWTFNGGSPNSSSNQHPQNIQYNSTGTYKVTLQASNSYGSDTKTKTDYIEVLPAPTCDTITNLAADDTGTVYYTTGNCPAGVRGWVSGHNCYGDLAKADSFKNTSSNLNYITGMYLYFGFAKDGGNGTTVDVTIWDSAHNVVATESIAISDVVTAVNNGNVIFVPFNPEVPVPSQNFFGGIQLNYGAGDTVALYTTQDGNTNPGTGYEQWSDGTWHTYSSAWGIESANYLWVTLTDSLPQAKFTASADTVCKGESVNFDASNSENANNYYWQFPGGNPYNSSNEQPSVSYDTVGTHDVSLYVDNGCGASDVKTKTNEITVIDPPNVSVTPSTADICRGDTVQLVATGAASYNWSPSSSLSSSTGDTVLAFPSDTTTYQVQGIDATGTCSSTDAATVNVKDLRISVTPDTTSICLGDTAQLVASGADNYTWGPSGSLSSSTGDTVQASPGDTTTYQVIGSKNGCSDTTYSLVNVFDNSANAQFSANTTSGCPGVTIDFDATSSTNTTSYDWDFPGGTPTNATGATPSVTYDTSGTYDVTLRALSGCGNDTLTKSNYITIHSKPSVSVTPSSTTICEGDSATLSASGANSYSWSPSSGLSSTTGSSVEAFPSSSTTYQVIGTNSNGCKDTATATVNVSSVSVSVSPSSPTICSGDSVTLTASGANSYTWSPSSGLSSTTGSSVEASPSSTKTYTVIGTNTDGCEDTTSVTVTVSGSAPTADFTASDTSICPGKRVIFDASSSNNANSYSWTYELGTPGQGIGVRDTSRFDNSGYFNVKLVVMNGCATDTLMKKDYVHVYNEPSVSVLPSSTTIQEGDSVQLDANGAPDYSWSPAIGLNTTTGSTVMADPNDTTTYRVIGYNANNCRDTAYATVNVKQDVGVGPAGFEQKIDAYVVNEREFVRINFSLEESHDVRIRLFNQLGQEVHYEEANVPARQSVTRNIQTSGLPSGVYFLNITNEGVLHQQKLMILR